MLLSKTHPDKESECLLNALSPHPAATSPCIASHTHPHTHLHTHSLQFTHTHTDTHTSLFSSLTSAALPTTLFRLLLWKLEQLLSGRHESEAFICLLVVCVFLPECVCMNANVCLPFVVVCVWPRRLISPVLCAACHDARTRLDTVYQHRPHGFAPPHLLFPFFSLLLPSVHPVLGLSPNMRLSRVCSGALWRWLKEKSVATVCIAI